MHNHGPNCEKPDDGVERVCGANIRASAGGTVLERLARSHVGRARFRRRVDSIFTLTATEIRGHMLTTSIEE